MDELDLMDEMDVMDLVAAQDIAGELALADLPPPVASTRSISSIRTSRFTPSISPRP